MTITPTDKGALIAGAGFWALVWALVVKLDAIPLVNKFISSKKILGWIRNNKTLCLIGTEVINLGMHPPSSAASTLFALGGTIANTCIIFAVMPLSDLISRRRRVV